MFTYTPLNWIVTITNTQIKVEPEPTKWHVDEIDILPGADPHNVKILLDTKDIKTHISDYNTISRNLSGFRKIKTSENHWDGFIITSVELIRKTLIGKKKTRRTDKQHTDTHSFQTLRISMNLERSVRISRLLFHFVFVILRPFVTRF